MSERKRTIEEQVAQEQLGLFQRFADAIGRLIRGTEDPEELQELKQRAANAKRGEEYWKSQLE
jgi:hypothetical protein